MIAEVAQVIVAVCLFLIGWYLVKVVFNQIDSTEKWRADMLARIRRGKDLMS